ncbi:MAG: hypothetical protein FJY65_04395 [Calditrichaeota bacterium]|nr:hypothetical protein [Calditrichota bacterium]
MKSLLQLGALFAALAVISISIPVLAEKSQSEDIENLKGKVDGMSETQLEILSTLNSLSKIKVSGYIQAQFQIAGSDGAANYSGGNFPSNVHQRFAIRRGRLKVNYIAGWSQYVLQFDVTNSGVGIKDAYLSITEPWSKDWSLWMGAFDRPFGFEISYSSSMRESPERSRMYQILFPGERDVGMKIEYAPEKGGLAFLRGKIGLFNGAGLPCANSAANENDNYKDVIGRIGVVLPMLGQNMELDAGLSVYSGKVRNQEKYLYTLDGSLKDWQVDSAASNKYKYFDRAYLGFDAQYYVDVLPLGGMSVRGEFITGKQPSLSGSNTFYNPTSGIDPALGLYQREFAGYYLNYVQNIGLFDQFVLKYDIFDPNTGVAGNDIGKPGAQLTGTDIAYSTLGLGWVHYIDSNTKLVFYYDMTTNEKLNSAASGSLAKFKEDVKDNILTVRMQYKF